MSNHPTLNGKSIKENDLLWQKAELEIERLENLERMLHRHYNKVVGDQAKESTNHLIKEIQKAIATQLQLQAEIEAFLIENEAPGWTST